MAGPDTGRRPDAWTAETIFADDLGPGDVFELGSHPVSEDELTRFAGEWDPQFFHVDAAAAEQGMFGGLIASGIHTMAVFQRLSVEGFWGRAATIAARGIRDVRFLQPVRPAVTLTGRILVEEVGHRDEHRSLVTVAGSLRDGSGAAVLTMTVDAYLARRRATG